MLFSKDDVWVKKDNPLFDVTMGSYNGAEVCELVGLYILDRIRLECPDIKLGLYRDDGLGITNNLSGQDTENLRNKLFQIFESQWNAKKTFLMSPLTWFQKGSGHTEGQTMIIHQNSNHPTTIMMQLPEMIPSHISDTSFDESEFKMVKNGI